MSVCWSEEQTTAIDHRCGNLLVSAAAGSGKTAVLVERILRRVCDEKNPVDIDRFVVVTFTNAAAAEMKLKISRELAKQISKDPSNRHLQRQMTLVMRARISTVHAFCLDLIRQNSHVLNTGPDLRILDDTEAELLRDGVFERFAEMLYEKAEENEIIRLVEDFAGQRGDGVLKNLILSLHSEMQSRVHPESRLEKYLAMYDDALQKGLNGHPWTAQLLDSFLESMRYFKELICAAAEELAADPLLQDKYGEAFMNDIALIDGALIATESGFNTLATYTENNIPCKLPVIRKPSDLRLKEKCKGVHDTFKDEYMKWVEGLLARNEHSHLEDIRAVLPGARSLCEAVERFGRAYEEEKRQIGALDFADIEHLAIQLLVTGYDGDSGSIVPTALADELAHGIEEVMVDEYQDTNEIQDVIFRSITEGKGSLFMVGDIKQSIYRFRLADPTIFLRRYLACQRGEEQAGTCVRLSRNYRSRDEVVDTVNGIFSHIMSAATGDVEYKAGEALIREADYPPSDAAAELDILDEAADAEGADTEDEAEDVSAAEAEAAHAARRIQKMLEEKYPVYDREGKTTRPCTPRDFVLLMRSVKGRAEIYQRALTKVGIESYGEQNSDCLKTPEILVMYAFLAVIDNPRQDVELAAVMRSPAFAFSADELAKVRLCKKDASLYDALLEACGHNNRAKEFVQMLFELRQAAEDMTVGDLVWNIFEKTALIYAYAAKPGGELRRANLFAFYELARRFERNSYRGLYSFVAYLRGLYELDKGMNGASAVPENADVVRVMSIHKSKGLEYPIVFLVNCGKRHNMSDLNEAVAVDNILGLGLKRRENDRGIEYTTIAREAVIERKRRDLQSEELRILYVAMTRAREKLVIVASAKNLRKRVQTISCRIAGEVHPYLVRRCSSYLDWLLCAAIACCGERVFTENMYPPPAFTLFSALKVKIFSTHDSFGSDQDGEDVQQAEKAAVAGERDVREILRRIQYTYPRQAAVSVPSKLTATQLKGGVFDTEIEDGVVRYGAPAVLRRPAFADGKDDPSAAERGVALHLAMQYIDFSQCISEEAIIGQLKQLAQRKLLTEQQTEWVPPDKILRFLATPLAKRLSKAKKAAREYKFSILMEAYRYIQDMNTEPYRDEKILLQGVVDCFFIEETKNLVVIDFKTDRLKEGEEQLKAELYRKQVEAYALALGRIFAAEHTEKWIYFFSTDKAFKL